MAFMVCKIAGKVLDWLIKICCNISILFGSSEFSVEGISRANPRIRNLDQPLHRAKLKILLLEILFFNPMLMSRLIHPS